MLQVKFLGTRDKNMAAADAFELPDKDTSKETGPAGDNHCFAAPEFVHLTFPALSPYTRRRVCSMSASTIMRTSS